MSPGKGLWNEKNTDSDHDSFDDVCCGRMHQGESRVVKEPIIPDQTNEDEEDLEKKVPQVKKLYLQCSCIN